MANEIDIQHIFECSLSQRHRQSGNTRHFSRGKVVPPPTRLVIAKYPDDAGCYLLHLDDRGKELTDTFHDSVEEALEQAEWEFRVSRTEWRLLTLKPSDCE